MPSFPCVIERSFSSRGLSAGWQPQRCAGKWAPAVCHVRFMVEHVGRRGVGHAALSWHTFLWPWPRLDRLCCRGGQNRLEVITAIEGVDSKQFWEIAIPQLAPLLDSCLSKREQLTLQRGVEGKMHLFFKCKVLLADETDRLFFCKTFFFFLFYFLPSV